METNLENLISKTAKELNFTEQQVRGAVNHLFNYQRQAFVDKTHASYTWYRFGSFNHLYDRGDEAVEATEFKVKSRKKMISMDNFDIKDGIIQEIKKYNYRTLLQTSYQKHLIRKDKSKQYLGFNYKTLIKLDVEQLNELLSFLKEHNKPIKKNDKTSNSNKNDSKS